MKAIFCTFAIAVLAVVAGCATEAPTSPASPPTMLPKVVVAVIPIHGNGCMTDDRMVGPALAIVERRFSEHGIVFVRELRSSHRYRAEVCVARMKSGESSIGKNGTEDIVTFHVRLTMVDGGGGIRYAGFGEDRYYTQSRSQNFSCFGRVLKRDVLRQEDVALCPDSPEEAVMSAAWRAFGNLQKL